MAEFGVLEGIIYSGMEHTYVINEPIVEGVSESNMVYLKSLFIAIKNVTIDYIRYTYHNENSNSASPKTIKRSKAEISHVERVFAYELYRQWCEQDIIRNTSRLIINAEIPKQLIDGEYEKTGKLYYPDMVLHDGQNNYVGNHVVCEIKRKENVDNNPKQMNDDIHKLIVYVSENKIMKNKKINWEPFGVGVFLMTVKDIKHHEEEHYSLDLISKHFNKKTLKLEKENVTKKIVCVIYNGQELIYDTLYNMINKK